MTVDNSFFIKKFLKKTAIFVAFSAASNMPFVVCDEETFNDRIWLFENEELVKKFAQPYLEKKYGIRAVKYPNKLFQGFFKSLYSMGVNEVVIVEESRQTVLELEQLQPKPDYSNLPPERKPLINDALVLTGMYFSQESNRPGDVQDKEKLEEYQEELASNMLKATYMLPITLNEGPGTPADKIKNNEYKVPVIKMNNGDLMIPIFTDAMELGKYSKGKPLAALPVNFNGLAKTLSKEVKGYMLNPAGFHLVMYRELLETLPGQFEEE